jgi:hypothetical protein
MKMHGTFWNEIFGNGQKNCNDGVREPIFSEPLFSCR